MTRFGADDEGERMMDLDEGDSVSAAGVADRPDVVYLVEWTDIFGKKRRALSLQKRDVESMRTVDPEARLTAGRVKWMDKTGGQQ